MSNIVKNMENFLKQTLAKELNVSIESIDAKAEYYDVGLDSQGFLKIIKAIEGKVGDLLPPTLLFEYTNIEELATYLAETYGSQIHFED